ncbi:cell cycle checkpoint control protein RAD9A [Paragonimus westermani]|uniref:Cell cycle checkpoint control protein RAD9A n=1 Tax=Paragonimus westermani TaxID=34504 RepID=A0A5J4P501_9TREM|nr:cell cycle checkpoint control protein RAD9A [Paragonimus westermani]
MKLSLHHTELKVFIRCINALSKLGHEIYFEWMQDGLILKTVNSSRSAYAAVTFKPIFFEKVSDILLQQTTRFKIPSRSCCNVFKLSTAVEKTVQKCRILLAHNDTLLVVQFFCKYAIVRTFNMTIIDCEHLEAIYSLEQSANHLVLSTKILGEVLNNFRQSSEEITVILKDGECTFQNYILQGDPNNILTQLPLSACEFDAYLVGCTCELTFCQKELRALLTFCELISPILRIYCDRPGHPIIFACSHETRLSAQFVLATLPPDAYSAPTGSQRSNSVQPHLLASKTPVQIRRLTNASRSINISTASHSALPEFHNDVLGDEVTLLATLPPVTPTDKSRQPETTHTPFLFASIENTNDLTHTQLVQPALSPPGQPQIPSRPFSIPRVRQSVRSVSVRV